MDWNTILQVGLPIINGQIRAALTGAGAILVANGAIQASQKDAFVSIGAGIITYGAGALWSAISKWLKAREVQKALMMKPPVVPPASVGEAVAIVKAAT